MALRDEFVTCAECGENFVYRVEDQRRTMDMGFEVQKPDTCPNCREEIVLGPGLHAGVVKWYNPEKHFGFITQRVGEDIFFHRSSVQGDIEAQLNEGAAVWYETEETDRGPQAINVHLRE